MKFFVPLLVVAHLGAIYTQTIPPITVATLTNATAAAIFGDTVCNNFAVPKEIKEIGCGNNNLLNAVKAFSGAQANPKFPCEKVVDPKKDKVYLYVNLAATSKCRDALLVGCAANEGRDVLSSVAQVVNCALNDVPGTVNNTGTIVNNVGPVNITTPAILVLAAVTLEKVLNLLCKSNSTMLYNLLAIVPVVTIGTLYGLSSTTGAGSTEALVATVIVTLVVVYLLLALLAPVSSVTNSTSGLVGKLDGVAGKLPEPLGGALKKIAGIGTDPVAILAKQTASILGFIFKPLIGVNAACQTVLTPFLEPLQKPLGDALKTALAPATGVTDAQKLAQTLSPLATQLNGLVQTLGTALGNSIIKGLLNPVQSTVGTVTGLVNGMTGGLVVGRRK